MGEDYVDGYYDAADFDWKALPLDRAIDLIDGYKQKAIEKRKEYYAGFADGAWVLVMARTVA